MENNKLQIASQLVSQKKFKKALVILKKVNKKQGSHSVAAYALEGACYANSHNYAMAEIAFKKALGFATSDNDKLTAYRNLKAMSLRQKKYDDAVVYLHKELEIDSSPKNALSRMQLCELSLQQGDLTTVEENLPKLLALSEYSAAAKLIYVKMYISSNKREALKYLNQLVFELDKLSEENTMKLLNGYIALGEKAKAEHILNQVRNEFGKESWFLQTENKLLNIDATELQTPKQPEEFETGHIVKGNNIKVVSIIEKLVTKLVSQGAYFHPEILLEENDNNLSVKIAKQQLSFQEYMSIPLACMPLTGDYEYKIDKNFQVTAKLKSHAVNPKASDIMALMLSLYNETDKLNTWRNNHPLLILFNYPSIAMKLISGKVFSSKIKRFSKIFEQRNYRELLWQTFLGAREFSFTREMLASVELKTEQTVERGLLTTIDFLNHKSGATGYSYDRDKSAIAVTGLPDPESKELFVQYNISDPFTTYLIYGFIDKSTPWVFSISSELFTRDGASILVLNDPVKQTRNLKPEAKHLRNFLPGMMQSNGKNIVVSSLIIPELNNYRSLKEVLAFILIEHDVFGKYIEPEVLRSEVSYLEKQLIENNIKYWQELSEELERLKVQFSDFPEVAMSPISTLCCHYLDHIQIYKEKMPRTA